MDVKIYKLYRPSSAPAIKCCAHYESDSRDTDDNQLGNQMHICWESFMTGGEAIIGPDMEDQHVEACNEIAVSCMNKVGETTLAPYDPKKAKREQHLYVTAQDTSPITDGTADIIYETDLEFDIVIDGKGCFDFDIENHYHKPQLANYGMGQMQLRGKKKVLCIEAYMMPNKMRSYFLTYDEAGASIGETVVRIKRKHDLPLQPNWSCKYCKNFLGCPALNEQLAMVTEAFQPVGKWLNDIDNIKDPVKLANAKNFAKIIDKMSERIGKAVTAFYEANDNQEDLLPTFIRKKQNGKKTITDMEEALNLSGMSQEFFVKACTVSQAKLAAQYRAEFGGTAKNAKEQIGTRLIQVTKVGEPFYKIGSVQFPKDK